MLGVCDPELELSDPALFELNAAAVLAWSAANRALGELALGGIELGALALGALGREAFKVERLALGVSGGLAAAVGFTLGELVTAGGDTVSAAGFSGAEGAAAIGAGAAGAGSSSQSESIASVAGGIDFEAAETTGSPSQPESMSSSEGSADPGAELGERTEDVTPMSSKVTGLATAESSNIGWGGKHLHARAAGRLLVADHPTRS